MLSFYFITVPHYPGKLFFEVVGFKEIYGCFALSACSLIGSRNQCMCETTISVQFLFLSLAYVIFLKRLLTFGSVVAILR